MHPCDRSTIDSDRSVVEFRLRSMVKNVGFFTQWTLKFEFSGFPGRINRFRGPVPDAFYISFSIFHLSEMMATPASQNRRAEINLFLDGGHVVCYFNILPDGNEVLCCAAVEQQREINAL